MLNLDHDTSLALAAAIAVLFFIAGVWLVGYEIGRAKEIRERIDELRNPPGKDTIFEPPLEPPQPPAL